VRDAHQHGHAPPLHPTDFMIQFYIEWTFLTMIMGVQIICRCIEKYITSLTHSKAEIMALMLPVHSTALSTPPLVISTSTWKLSFNSEIFGTSLSMSW
jgi:hypothetical protein